MLDNEPEETPASTEAAEVSAASQPSDTPEPARKTAKKSAAKKTTRKSNRKSAAKKSAGAAAPGESQPDSQPGSQPESQSGTPAEGEPGQTQAAEAPTGAAESEERPAKKAAAKKTTKKTTAKKAAAKKSAPKASAKKATDPATTDRATTDPATTDPATTDSAPTEAPAETTGGDGPIDDPPATVAETTAENQPQSSAAPAAPGASLLFQPPDPVKAVPRKRTRKKPQATEEESPAEAAPAAGPADTEDTRASDENREAGEEPADDEAPRRRRRRGGRRRRKGGQDDGQPDSEESAAADSTGETKQETAEKATDRDGGKKDTQGGADSGEESTGTRRRRRRRRSSEANGDTSTEDPANTVVRVRESRKSSDDEISGFTGSTRLEAKKQRRREGREAGRRRAPIVSEAEFLARRESVDRTMVVRQHDGLTQIAVLEDKMLVEHYVAREAQTSLIGNVYLGRVQNVLPSMEAAFVDIGKGRNAVLYAGEVNWSALGMDGQPRRIESALKSGQPVLVQVTKDPVGHKGARLTGQISLPGRYLVYVPGGQTSGISRKLPDTERNRLKNLLKEIVPSEAGVIIRTAAEGASEDELRRDVARLTARWEDIEKKVEAGNSPALLYGEPDMTVKVIRDLFTEDFGKLVVSGEDAWDTIEGYVQHVAPDLMERVERWDGSQGDVFASHRVDEQITKGLDRKVFLPSGGSLVIDRTEAMTVVDVNTGKFTGSGGNLEETVTKNNLEAAEEIVRQLRLRDIGGIIVIDFIDMVLESNRDLVLRRLIECLGRDRTKHQVAEVTSLGLVQMTRKRVGTGLLEAFSESCEQCGGRGVIVHHEPVLAKKSKREDDDQRRGKRGRRRGGGEGKAEQVPAKKPEQVPEEKAVPAPEKKPEPVESAPEPADQSAQPVDGPAEQPAGTAEPTPAKEPVAAPAEQPAAETTEQRSRPKRGRRRASRPQAEASASADHTADKPAAPPVVQPTTSTEPSSAEPSSAEPSSPRPTVEPTAEPAVTPPRRGRRRAASRPAGPPQQ